MYSVPEYTFDVQGNIRLLLDTIQNLSRVELLLLRIHPSPEIQIIEGVINLRS